VVLKIESAKKSGVGQPIPPLLSEIQVATTNAGARTARRLDPRLFGALQPDAQPLTASLQVTLRLESTLLGCFRGQPPDPFWVGPVDAETFRLPDG
jgi:hypothetical protein